MTIEVNSLLFQEFRVETYARLITAKGLAINYLEGHTAFSIM